MHLHLKILFIFIIQLKALYILCQNDVQRSVSSSVASMEDLLEIEKQALVYLENYSQKLQHKVDIITKNLQMLHEEHKKFKTSEEAYISCSLKSFSLINRLSFNWHDWNVFLKDSIGAEEVKNLLELNAEFPNELEFTETVDSVHRLQSFYNISTADMVNGTLNGNQYDAQLSALDAFAIARNLFSRSMYQTANDWIKKALQIHDESFLNNMFEYTQSDLYALYAEAQFNLGNHEESLMAIKRALSLDPFNSKLKKRSYDMEFDVETRFKHVNSNGKSDLSQIYGKFESIVELSKKACAERPRVEVSNLDCRLENKVNYFVKLAPFKVEELSLNPYVVKFYDIISDEEIAHLKNMSRNSLERSRVADEDTKMGVVESIRTVKNAWLSRNLTKVTSIFNVRLSDMTGFELNGSEPLQTMNYGLAGHYIFHSDYFGPSENEYYIEYGDRIATVLIYMSDVTDGGETIFPDIGITVKPEKGTALLWYNLDDKGDPEEYVGHIACPVIVGSKWAATKWIHERNQFRSRPCLPRKKI